VSLAETQAQWARLFTQRAARSALAQGPNRDEALAGEIERFALGLLAKRRMDVAKWLPLTARALGPDFGPRLRETMAEPPPGARADALALVARLRGGEPPWIGELAAYEGEFLRAWGPQGRFVVRAYRWPVHLIADRLTAGEAVGDAAPKRTLALWARRPGGRLRHRTWTLART